MNVPFFRPSIGEEEIAAVTEVLRSGWLTTGAQCRAFEAEFAEYVGAKYAVAVNSCTAALHLALEAIGLQRGDGVLVPAFTFAATAEVVRYFDAKPVLVDCVPGSLNMDLECAEWWHRHSKVPIRAIIPMHYAGQPMLMDAVRFLARTSTPPLRVIEDAAHALPAAYADGAGGWHRIGANTADATCFSFYPNKTITTGEGGMLVTDDPGIAERAQVMSLHGISKDAWKRYTDAGSWYYEIAAPGFKYNLTDIAAAIGRVQLRKCDALAAERSRLADNYCARLADVEQIELPCVAPQRQHAWHLFVIRLHLDRLRIDRAAFIEELKRRGVSCSVAWMPLHLHPYYRDKYGYQPDDFPVASREWLRIISLPLFPGMTEEEQDAVVAVVRAVVTKNRR